MHIMANTVVSLDYHLHDSEGKLIENVAYAAHLSPWGLRRPFSPGRGIS